MKRVLVCMLSLALLLALAACGKAEQPPAEPESLAEPEPPQAEPAEPEPVSNTVSADPVEDEDGWTEMPETAEPELISETVETDGFTFTDCEETVYATSAVNLRSGPGTSYDKVGSLSAGQSVTRTGIGAGAADGWSRVQTADGSTVYVSSSYISTSKPVQQAQTSKPADSTANTNTGGTQSGGGGSVTPSGVVDDSEGRRLAEEAGMGLAGLEGIGDPNFDPNTIPGYDPETGLFPVRPVR